MFASGVLASCVADGRESHLSDRSQVFFGGIESLEIGKLEKYPKLSAIARATPTEEIQCNGVYDSYYRGVQGYQGATECWLREPSTVKADLEGRLRANGVDVRQFGLSEELCPATSIAEEKWHQMPTDAGATGFLVNEESLKQLNPRAASWFNERPHPDLPLLMTSEHVIHNAETISTPCGNLAFIFDFREEANRRTLPSSPHFDVGLLSFCESYASTNWRYGDGAVVAITPPNELDKREPFEVATYDSLSPDANVYTLGHPMGTYAMGSHGKLVEFGRRIDGLQFVRHQLSTFAGSSGSPIIIQENQQVIGIQARGGMPAEPVFPKGLCYRSEDPELPGCRSPTIGLFEAKSLQCDPNSEEACIGLAWADHGLARELLSLRPKAAHWRWSKQSQELRELSRWVIQTSLDLLDDAHWALGARDPKSQRIWWGRLNSFLRYSGELGQKPAVPRFSRKVAGREDELSSDETSVQIRELKDRLEDLREGLVNRPDFLQLVQSPGCWQVADFPKNTVWDESNRHVLGEAMRIDAMLSGLVQRGVPLWRTR